MARVRLFLDGSAAKNGAPLVMHNERLADPLNEYSLEIGKLSKMRNKTEATHLEIAKLEFVGGMYHDDELGPYIPTWNIVRCIQNAAKQHKMGAAVLRGVIPATEKAPVLYEGPRDINALWETGENSLRKSVGIGSSRTMRTRPIFTDWSIVAEVEVDLTQVTPEKIDQFLFEGGKFQALGDYRPVYGRFFGKAELVTEKTPAREKQEVK